MVVLDYIYTALVVMWSKHDTVILGGFILALVISWIKTYTEGRLLFWEGVLCGVISAIVWVSATALGVPVGLQALISGMIGFFGSKQTMEYLRNRLLGEKKTDEDDSSKLQGAA